MQNRKSFISSIASLLIVAGCAGQPAATTVHEDRSPVVQHEQIDETLVAAPTTSVNFGEKRPVLMAESAAPATQPALPSGHPDISEMMKQRQAQKGQLPAGHPDVNEMKKGGGMPKMGGGKLPGPLPQRPQLPAGHPDMSQMQQAAPSTQPAAGALGTLKVKAVQGTRGGPAPSELTVNVEMVLPDKTALDKFEAKLGKDGTLLIEGLPTSKAFSPLVRINYGGVDYEAMGTPFDAEHITQDLEVKVYESTAEEPAWEVKMQHVMIEPAPGNKLQVVEMLAVDNPTDKAWTGKEVNGQKSTLTLPLPPGAADVALVSGFHDCCTRIQSDKVVNTMALNPGTTQYRIAYTVPVSAGKAALDFTTPAKVANMIIFAPEAVKVAAEGVKAMGKSPMGDGSQQYFRATEIPAGKSVKLNLSEVPAVAGKVQASDGQPAAATAPGSAQDVTRIAKAIAGTGAVLILLFGTAFVLVKAPKAKRKVA